MKPINKDDLFKQVKRGNISRDTFLKSTKKTESVTLDDREPIECVADELESLNEYVKQIVTKKDNTLLIMQLAEAVSKTLLKVVDRIDNLQPQEQVKSWDISVARGSDKLIKTLTMKAG